MKFIALISGGKDSFYNLYHCLSQGHELVALGNLYPKDESQAEIDSFMFQTVGHEIISAYSQCLDVPLYRKAITGSSLNQELEYSRTEDDEIEDLFSLISEVKNLHPDIEAISCGAILSNYQRTRVENVCDRLGLTSLAYLWQRDQNELMSEMCDSGLDARIVKVAAIGLNASHLGQQLNEIYPHLVKLNSMYDVHICGEGGEFETIVLDCPFFKDKRLKIVDQQIVRHSSEVFYLKLQVELEEKDNKGADINTKRNLVAPPLLDPFWVDFVESEFKTEAENENVNKEGVGKSQNLQEVLPEQYTPTSSIIVTSKRLFISNLTSTAHTIEDQMTNIFTQLLGYLKNHDLSWSHIQHVNLLLSDLSSFELVNKIYGSYFSDMYLPPSRICVETGISTDIQLSCVVLKDKSRKSGVHVRSRSFWGPQNIGPYSQSITDTEPSSFKLASLSGQIPLIPASMTLSRNTIAFNSALSLKHLTNVEQLVGATKFASVICFITSHASLGCVKECWQHLADHRNGEFGSVTNLVIAEVNALPKMAEIEWGGFSFQETFSVYQEEEDEEEEENEFDRGFSKSSKQKQFKNSIAEFGFEFSSFCSIADGAYTFVMMFTSDVEKINKFLQAGFSPCQCITTSPICSGSAEFIPVRKLYNYAGEEFQFCIIYRQEL
ncbi:hypothetical protein KGF56_004768 [Candida oxycetoniae]|uniref:Diphthine--ammonia ligase n=1 Tax=Candida oxycetoniae TaxID=497107 RepID=A0AAI9WVR7_9ASCO|nr:uncharacterized protein KGF56_004768 [Candida oxycetoniae]KAI3402360.2 hypothetical protein KGF56_004768 [Candida oxycetoniae]